MHCWDSIDESRAMNIDPEIIDVLLIPINCLLVPIHVFMTPTIV